MIDRFVIYNMIHNYTTTSYCQKYGVKYILARYNAPVTSTTNQVVILLLPSFLATIETVLLLLLPSSPPSTRHGSPPRRLILLSITVHTCAIHNKHFMWTTMTLCTEINLGYGVGKGFQCVKGVSGWDQSTDKPKVLVRYRSTIDKGIRKQTRIEWVLR